MTIGEAIQKYGPFDGEFYRKNPGDKIFWTGSSKYIMAFFTFDKRNVYTMYGGFSELTENQARTFCKENPRWKDYFPNLK